MNRSSVLLSIFVGVFAIYGAYGDVTVTEPTGGNDVPADRAVNSTNGAAYTSLGDIILTEGSASDFTAGNGQTFILTLPAGWQFNPVGASVSFLNRRDITAANI